MIRFLSLITATLFFLQAMAGSLGNINGTYWHDGYAFFKVKESKGVLHFSGGTLHEGGYEFNVVKGRGGKMVIASSYENFDIIPLTGKSASGSTIERKTVAGNDVLVVTSPKGKVTDVLLRLDKDSSFEDVQIDQLNKQLDGVYRNAQGKYLAFNGNNAMSTTPSQNKWDNFKFLSSFDIPTNIIEVLKTGKHYSFDFDKQNIKLDEVKCFLGRRTRSRVNYLREIRQSGRRSLHRQQSVAHHRSGNPPCWLLELLQHRDTTTHAQRHLRTPWLQVQRQQPQQNLHRTRVVHPSHQQRISTETQRNRTHQHRPHPEHGKGHERE